MSKIVSPETCTSRPYAGEPKTYNTSQHPQYNQFFTRKPFRYTRREKRILRAKNVESVFIAKNLLLVT